MLCHVPFYYTVTSAAGYDSGMGMRWSRVYENFKVVVCWLGKYFISISILSVLQII